MYLKFVGDPGEFLAGVPGRDLSEQEINDLDSETQAVLANHLANVPHPIYKRMDGDPPEPKRPRGTPDTEPEPIHMGTDVVLQEAAPEPVAELDLKPDEPKPDQASEGNG